MTEKQKKKATPSTTSSSSGEIKKEKVEKKDLTLREIRERLYKKGI